MNKLDVLVMPFAEMWKTVNTAEMNKKTMMVPTPKLAKESFDHSCTFSLRRKKKYTDSMMGIRKVKLRKVNEALLVSIGFVSAKVSIAS